MTPVEFIQLINQQATAGAFKMPLTMALFESIRAMSDVEAQEVKDLYNAKKLIDLKSKKDDLISVLAKVQSDIAEAEKP